jgi:hypothetical protein
VSLNVALVFQAAIQNPAPRGGTDAAFYHVVAATVGGFGGDLRFAIDGMADKGWTLPLLMAASYRAVGAPSPAAFGLLQALVLLPATTALVYVAGRYAFGRRVGLVATWGFALWFPLVYHTAWLLPETTVGVLTAGVLALAAMTITGRGGWWASVGLGLALGLLGLTHPAWQFLPFVMVAAFAVHFRAYARERLLSVALVGLGACAILLPYAIVQEAAGLPRPGAGGIAYGGAWSMWVGSRPWTHFGPTQSDYTLASVNETGGVRQLARLIQSGDLETDPYLSRLILEKAARPEHANVRLTDGDYYRAAVHNLLADPTVWPRKTWHGLTTVLLPPPALVLGTVAGSAQQGGALYPPTVKQAWIRRPWRSLGAILAIVMLAGFVLVVLHRRDRLVLFVPLLFQTAVFVVGAPEARYGYPLVSSVMVLAAYALIRLRDAVQGTAG